MSLATAQTLPAPTTKSPNAGILGKFTNIPVNLFTGTPDISIPIHVLKYGSIEVPISLRYHPGAVKPAQHPGWVGLGWDLQSVGEINRTIRGQADDPDGSPGTNTAPGTLSNSTNNYTNAYFPVVGGNSPCGADIANASDWDSQARLYSDCLYYVAGGNGSLGALYNDVQADEFSFNFMGYSGTFYYSGTSLGWQVKSDQNIQVTFNGFLNAEGVISAIKEFQTFNLSGPQNYLPTSSFQPNVFSGFTLTVPDGTKYTFGGSEGIEFSSDYKSGNASFTAVTWLLTKIVDVNNNEVDFSYQRIWPTVNLSFNQVNQNVNAYATSSGLLIGSPCGGDTYTNATVGTRTYGAFASQIYGTLQWPMYLSKISCPNETIAFNISDASCLRDPNLEQIVNGGGTVQSNSFNYNWTPYNPLGFYTSNLRWEQLNDIIISNSSQNNYRQYHFDYSTSLTQRLTLNNFYEKDNAGNTVDQYHFNYNNLAAWSTLYYDGDFTDHWGYYNNSDVQGITLNNIFTVKQTNPSLVTTGLLTQITYPTGGYTKFTWEAHDYSQVVSNTRNSLVPASGYAGGSRVSEIASFDKIGTILSDKKYYYKTGYTAGSNVSTLPSSGTLNGMPTYTFAINNRLNYQQNAKFSIQLAALNSLATYSYNGSDSYIGYDEVTEVNEDGSYTRNFFTNYGPDLNGVSHWDILPTGYIGWSPGDDVYFPMSSLEGERGKPIGIYQYTKNDVLVQKINYTYRNDAARFNNYIKLIDYNTTYTTCTGGYFINFASARKQFTYDYYPVTKTLTTYDQQGNNPFAVTENYSYDANNMLTTKTAVNSRGETEVTNYTYTTEAPDAISPAMKTAHILSPVFQIAVTNNGNPVSLVHTNYYSPYTNYYLPQTVQLQTAGNPIETREQVYQYDTHGNVQEESNTGGVHDVYLWGYNSQYLVAKITNTTLTAVQQAMAGNNLTQAMLDNAATSTDAQMRTWLATLRTSLTNSQVTTYTYAPITGMTSATDPKGETTYYEYDSFQRLMNIKNKDGNIVKHYDYHYQGQ
jgi:YD repeat-containing protein